MAAKKKSPAKSKKPAPRKTSAKKPVARKAPAKKTSSKSAPRKSASGKKAAPSRKGAPRKGAARRPARTSKRPSPSRKAAPKKVVSKGTKARVIDAPEALALARAIARVATEKKAEDVMIVDVRVRSSAVGYDYVVLASGESDRQLSAISEGVDELLKPQGKRAASVEASPDWVCVNYDEGVVAHFFTPDKRSMMDLEGLWSDAPRVSP